MLAHDYSLTQFLRSQVAQGFLTHEQAQERLALSRTSAAHSFQEQNVPQQTPLGLTTGGMVGGSAQQQMAMYSQQQQRQQQQQQQYNASAYPPGMGLPQGQEPPQQRYIQPYPPAPPAFLQPSTAPSASQPTPLSAPQFRSLPRIFVEMPVLQLSNVYSQLVRNVEDGEKNLNAAGTGGESDMHRQALRARLDSQRQVLVNIRDLINLKRQGGDPAQQAVNGAPWSRAGQQATAHYSVPEPPPQDLAFSAAAQPNYPQIPPHVSNNALPFNDVPAQMPGPPPQPPPQAPHQPPQRTFQCSKLPPLPEDRFKALFAQFAHTTGLRLNDQGLFVDGRSVSLWALHRAVFARNGFDSVTANDEWSAVGAALGFAPLYAGSHTQPPRSSPIVAHRLQQIYNDYLRHFEQAYINNVLARLRSSYASSQGSTQPSQQQAQTHQPTDADYQALLASIPSDSSVMTAEAMGLLPLFSHASRADLEAHRVPSPIVAFVEKHRDHLQRAAQDQNGPLRTTESPPLTYPPQQQSVQSRTLPPLSEDRFKELLTQFANATGIRPNYRDFVIDGRSISPWALHRAVFARNGFDTVTVNDEWPAVGAAMGFAPYYAVEIGQPPRCGPITANQLQQLYNGSLRHFDQYYVNDVLAKPKDVQVLDQRA
ncbi:hypothetical protein H4582DRAFT_1981117 [Lactarius indigo]|nr:hypothetical protein H4582DRAFT_1981117 [Lactarius indigo]